MCFDVVKRELRRITSRPIYLVGILLVPAFMSLLFVSLLGEGLPEKVPAAIVDLDHTPLSRQTTRSLNAMELVDIVDREESYNQAIRSVQEGKIMGFFVIPEDFEKDAIGGKAPTITFYCNLTYYVPGSLVFKGFKTMAVTTSGRIVANSLVEKGISQGVAGAIIQPMNIAFHPLRNPWTNYSYYLSSSFLPGLLELMIFLMTAYSITMEIKRDTAPEWIRAARGRISTAILGKLFPQTLLFLLVGVGMMSLMYGWHHFPMNGSMGGMLLAMLLFVIACQSFAVGLCALLPNPRYALSLCSLTGILAFSLAAFSYPVESMYGAVGIFSYILPVRYYFLIYLSVALDGVPVYFVRLYYVALLGFPIVAMLLSPLYKRVMLKPVYVQ